MATRAARLDRRVGKEAKALCREARKLLAGKLPSEDARLLARRLEPVAAALEGRDLAAVRAGLPGLDAAVDKLASGARKPVWREYVESISVAVLIALFLRAFVVEAFKIPSASMIPTMQIGDFIFVNKFLYGVRVPYTKTKLFEVRKPHRGEVIVFMQPCTPERDFIKRIVATEGDTVEVRCEVLYVNGKPMPSTLHDRKCHYQDYDETLHTWSPVSSCSTYRDTIGGYTFEANYSQGRPDGPEPRNDFPTLDDFGDQPGEWPGGFVCDKGIDRRDPEERDRARGKVVRIAPRTAEHDECQPQLHYVVPPGHVFCMGDNRWNSNDSRGWGPVPLENIKGKAMFIWFSLGPNNVRWGRIGDFVH